MERKTVMSWLEGLAQEDWRQFHSDSEVSNIAKAALELLEEQETLELVRCGDCKHATTTKSGLITCGNFFRSRNWFCADGDRKDS